MTDKIIQLCPLSEPHVIAESVVDGPPIEVIAIACMALVEDEFGDRHVIAMCGGEGTSFTHHDEATSFTHHDEATGLFVISKREFDEMWANSQEKPANSQEKPHA